MAAYSPSQYYSTFSPFCSYFYYFYVILGNKEGECVQSAILIWETHRIFKRCQDYTFQETKTFLVWFRCTVNLKDINSLSLQLGIMFSLCSHVVRILQVEASVWHKGLDLLFKLFQFSFRISQLRASQIQKNFKFLRNRLCFNYCISSHKILSHFYHQNMFHKEIKSKLKYRSFCC